LCHLIGCALPGGKRPTRIVAKDRTVVIPADAGSGNDCNMLLDWYLEGCRYPSKRFVEPAFAYCEQILSNRGRGKIEPRVRSITTLMQSVENGFAEEVLVLFRDVPAASLIDDAFELWCREALLKIWEESTFISA
jgi:hypothetical protein